MTFDYTIASPAELRAEYIRISKVTGDDQFFTKKEIAHLPNALAQGEILLAFSSGLMDGNTWLIALTDRRILFLDKGMLYGLKQISIDLERVNAVSGKTGLLLGEIQIEDGATNRTIRNVLKTTVTPFTNAVRDATEARRLARGTPSAPAPAVTMDVISQLERLAALKNQGVLTEEEFMAQKAKILV